ncbi:MAG: cellulase family glycosylhydrolase [Magnetococcales bacterium]|nr:cellulase family glycosylhydrolase [Magnetococcales bacterium]
MKSSTHLCRVALFFEIILLVGMVLLATGHISPVQAEEPPPPLRRGVNLSHWLQYQGRQPIDAQDLRLIRESGFDHVRIPFDPVLLGWQVEKSDPQAPFPRIALLDQAVQAALQGGLAVVIDFHPTEEMRERIEMVRSAQEAFVAAWAFLAGRFATTSPGRVAFELLNEPQYYKRSVRYWNRLWRDALVVVRTAAPYHLVLIGAPHGSDVEGILQLDVLPDPRIRYVFHFYEPYLITHNGANWEPFASSPVGMARGLLYPAKRLTSDVLPGKNSLEVKQAVAQYRQEEWGRARIAQRIALAGDWGRRHHVQLLCGEFGAMRLALETDSRQRWLKDVRISLEQADMGWTVWDYADLFGIAHTEGDAHEIAPAIYAPNSPQKTDRVMDPAILRHLVGYSPDPVDEKR